MLHLLVVDEQLSRLHGALRGRAGMPNLVDHRALVRDGLKDAGIVGVNLVVYQKFLDQFRVVFVAVGGEIRGDSVRLQTELPKTRIVQIIPGNGRSVNLFEKETVFRFGHTWDHHSPSTVDLPTPYSSRTLHWPRSVCVICSFRLPGRFSYRQTQHNCPYYGRLPKKERKEYRKGMILSLLCVTKSSGPHESKQRIDWLIDWLISREITNMSIFIDWLIDWLVEMPAF